MKIAIIGGGWAGMAAALAVVQAGHYASVFEAARTVGGRARAVVGKDLHGTPMLLDNGQHILIGAYAESLRLMRLVGVDPEKAQCLRAGRPVAQWHCHVIGGGLRRLRDQARRFGAGGGQNDRIKRHAGDLPAAVGVGH